MRRRFFAVWMKRHIGVLLASFVILTSGGCIVLPGPGLLVPKGNRFAGRIGPEDSAAPLRVGTSTRPRVKEVLGKPDEIWEAPGVWFYRDFTVRTVLVWLWPFVHGGPIQPELQGYQLRIDFASDGRIAKYAIW
jgi:hypothetical protein